MPSRPGRESGRSATSRMVEAISAKVAALASLIGSRNLIFNTLVCARGGPRGRRHMPETCDSRALEMLGRGGSACTRCAYAFEHSQAKALAQLGSPHWSHDPCRGMRHGPPRARRSRQRPPSGYQRHCLADVRPSAVPHGGAASTAKNTRTCTQHRRQRAPGRGTFLRPGNRRGAHTLS